MQEYCIKMVSDSGRAFVEGMVGVIGPQLSVERLGNVIPVPEPVSFHRVEHQQLFFNRPRACLTRPYSIIIN